MKRKVKRYAEGETVESSDTYETPKFEEKDEESKFDVEAMKKGIAAGTPTDRQTARDLQSFKAAEVRFAQKKRKPKAEPKASQSFPVRDFEEKTTTVKTSPSDDKSSGLGVLGAGAGAVAAGLLAARRGMKDNVGQTKIEPKMESRRALSGSTIGKMPGPSMSDPNSMVLGSDLDPKMSMKKNSRLSKDADFKKGGQTKKMASGGKTSSASSRGDGIAQRGKTKGRIC